MSQTILLQCPRLMCDFAHSGGARALVEQRAATGSRLLQTATVQRGSTPRRAAVEGSSCASPTSTGSAAIAVRARIVQIDADAFARWSDSRALQDSWLW